jgi:glycosyltransferase involved in cell wall biosynthesis
MRIAIITENFLPKLDGVTRTLAMLLEHLQRQRHQALVLGPEAGMEQYAGAEIVGTFGLPLPVYPEIKLNFFRPLFLRRLQAFQPDVIHLVDPAFLGVAGIAVANLLKKPIISSYHTNLAAYCRYFGAPFLTKPMWKYNCFLHNKCSLTFCPSPSTARILQTQGFQRVRIWPRGVDTRLFSPQRSSEALRHVWLNGTTQPEGKTIILYVGRVSWEKNLRLLVDTYQHMDHSRCHLVIVGDGPASAEMQRELAHLPATFTGYLCGEALATAYASADVFAFPSLTETFGQVVLEAMASGLPVVGLLSEGVCDLVNHGHSGYLLDVNGLSKAEQVESYRQYLTQLIDNPAKRTVMGQQAFKEAQQRSWHAAMECLVRGYEEVSGTDRIRAVAS